MSTRIPRPFISQILSAFLMLLSLAARPAAPAQAAAAITVSGTVSGPGGPVSQAWVGVWTPEAWRETATNAAGFYSVATQTSGEVTIIVRPPRSTMLSTVACGFGGITSSFTHDFQVVPGHLLNLRPVGRDGQAISGEFWLSVNPLINSLPAGCWLEMSWNEPVKRYEGVLPPDIYEIMLRNLPPGYYDTHKSVDLRAGDQNVTLPLSTEYVHPIPYEPPVAAKITVGAPDGLGEALVTGAPGAALPLAHVFLVNLNSTHQADTVSAADGSFSARIFAPPGSALMVKHGGASGRWHALPVGVAEGLNPYPGTILHVPQPTGGAGGLAFASAGAARLLIDDVDTTRNYVSAAWTLDGSVSRAFIDGEWSRRLDGTYQGTLVPGLYQGGLNWAHPALADLDADGDLDLLVGEESGHLVFYRNTGSPSAPNWKFVTAEFAGFSSGGFWAYPALADVNGDNAPDLLVGGQSGAIKVFFNDGTPAAPAWPANPDVSLTAGQNAAPALEDLDGDGDLDLFAGGESGTLTYFRNTGTRQAPAWSFQTSSYGGISETGGFLQPVFVDLDGDADRDLLLGLCGQVAWYRRGGSAASPTWTRESTDPIGFEGGSCANSPAAGDWDGDGDRDLIFGEHLGLLKQFRNDGPPNWTRLDYSYPFDLLGESAPALADWDNDGDLDLLVGQVHGDVHRFTNTGSNANPNWRPDGILLTLPWTNHPHAFPALADIDHDGDKDLFIGEGGWQEPGSAEAGGNLHYYRNDGTPAVPNWTLVSDAYLGLDVGGWSTPAFADIDSDGDLDLFIGCSAGTLAFVKNIGSPGAPAWAAPVQPYAGLQLAPYSAPAFIDVDTDGDLDLLSGTQSGSLAYVKNTGTTHEPAWDIISTSYPGIEIGGNSIPAAGDLSGDGKPDLLLGDRDGGVNLFIYEGPGDPPPADDSYEPGDLFRIRSTLRIYSKAFTSATDPSSVAVQASLYLLKQNDAQGSPVPAENYYMSALLTPAGFPIQNATRAMVNLNTQAPVGSLRRAGARAVEGDLVITGKLPAGLPDGIYRPVVALSFEGVPANNQDWLAANTTFFTFLPNEAALPPITVGEAAAPRLAWRLLMDDFVQGTRGAGAREDQGRAELASMIVSQGGQVIVPPVDERTGQPLTYRLEPFLPMISFTDRRMPTPPLIPLKLPGGQLHVTIQYPDGSVKDLGTEAFAQSFNRTKTTRSGEDLNTGTVQLEDVYSLKAASNRFRVTFTRCGHHVITMTGSIQDVWGNTYTGGGQYDIWVAHPLDLDPGVLPGTPLSAGSTFNTAVQVYPGVPADVNLKITHYPNSDPAQKVTLTASGKANDFGYFSPGGSPLVLSQPGEYRVELAAQYTDPSGKLYMASQVWGGVVMTPPAQAQLVAHGRRGLDSLTSIPNHWFVSSRDLDIPEGAVSHSYNPYYNGDIFWSRMSDGPYGGDSLLIGASVQDQVGAIKAAVQERFDRMQPGAVGPGSPAERFSREEIPLFISTRSGIPPAVAPGDVDQLAYSYRSSQRPGVRVREVVTEDSHNGGYWRLDTTYDDQLSVGLQGDLPNDYKFQYVGVVYRDLVSGRSEYLGQGTGWIFIPDGDPVGSRVMPPFAGTGNGGWTTEGGPILTLKGKVVDIFILPTGVQAGSILEVGDFFQFGGHIMPTLPSQVTWTATAPNGVKHNGGGTANPVGYFYDPADNFTVDQPGLWTLDVRVVHNGTCSGGQTVAPYPSGDVLGSENGRLWFYVVPAGEPALQVVSPAPGFLEFQNEVTPVAVAGAVPGGWNGVTLDYTIRMPGYILKHGQAAVSGGAFSVVFDPASLQQDFPNLDLTGRDSQTAGLSDTFSISLLLRGTSGGRAVSRAASLTIQGEQVLGTAGQRVFLPAVMRR